MLNKKYLSNYYTTTRKELEPKGARLAKRRRRSNFWKPVEGENTIRLVSWEIDPYDMPEHIQEYNTVRDEKGAAIMDDGKPVVIVPFAIPFKTHDMGNGMIICGNTYGSECELCKRGSELWWKYGDRSDNQIRSRREFARSHFSVERYISLILPIEDTDKIEDYFTTENISLYQFGKEVWLGIAGLYAAIDRKTNEPKYGDIADRESGRIIRFNRVGTRKEDTRYNGFEAYDDISPLPKDFVAPDLYEYLLNLYPPEDNALKIEKGIEDSMRREESMLQGDRRPLVTKESNNANTVSNNQYTQAKANVSNNTANKAKLDKLRQKFSQRELEEEIGDDEIEIDIDVEDDIPF